MAVAELSVLSPLREAGMNKSMIRELSHGLGLPTWNKQSFACLSSRFVYGEEITEENFAKHLYSAGIPDPELIIRPSGELRLSNFLLWQCAYSEFYFCDTLWPDFAEKDLDAAIVAYQQRDRRFGGVK